MPPNLTYPGVYVEELTSGVRSIVGVPTSIAAFIGPAVWGPTDKAVRITSFSDFSRRFGADTAGNPLGRAVHQYYQNGGQEAVVVRITAEASSAQPPPAGGGPTPAAAGAPKAASLKLGDKLVLLAKHAGSAGNGLRARVDHNTSTPKDYTLYNLTIRDTLSGAEEQYLNVTVGEAGTKSLPRLLKSSELVTLDPGSATGDALKTAPKPNSPAGSQNPWKDRKVEAAPVVGTGTGTGAGTGTGTGTAAVATAPDPDPQYSYKVDTPGSDGSGVPPAALDYLGGKQGEAEGKGIYALRDETTFFNMLCLPSREAIGAEVWAAAAQVCAERRAMLIVDPPPSTTKDWNDVGTVADVCQGGYFDSLGDFRKNAVLYFPRLVATGDDGPHTEYPPCGVIAGIWARTDGQRGVWKAPAGTEATVVGATDLALTMNNLENGTLNVLGINCLRRFPIIGQVVWGARTMVGADAQTSEWKYLPVRRLALFLEESLFRGSQWIVFEPNDEPLWAQIRLNFGAFLHDMFRQGAFQGSTPKDAYFVKCDRETTTQNDIDRGIVNIVVGFAPLKPAEFVVIQLQQMAGQIEV